VKEQEMLNRSGTDIFVSFSSRFREVSLPDPGSVHDDGLTKEHEQLITFLNIFIEMTYFSNSTQEFSILASNVNYLILINL